MPARDFMPFITGSGGTDVRYGRLDASASFREGEMVFVNNDGEIEELPVDDSVLVIGDMETSFLGGVAAMDGDTARTDGFARTGDGTAQSDLISYWPINQGIQFITRNVVSAADTAATPTGVMVGESFQIHGSNATTLTPNWEILTTAGVSGVDIQALIQNVLNVRKEPISAADTTTGVWVVFEIVATVGAA